MEGFAFIVEGMSITLRPVLWSRIDLEVEGPSWTGAACHSIIGLSLLSLQAISTDLKPIEHVWDLLDRRVRAWAMPPRNVRELAGALVEE